MVDRIGDGEEAAPIEQVSTVVPVPVNDEVTGLLAVVDGICGSELENDEKRQSLFRLSSSLHTLEMEARYHFIQAAIAKGVVCATVELLELGRSDLECVTAHFLMLLSGYSDMGAHAVLQLFDRIAARFKRVFEGRDGQHFPLLEKAIMLCENIAAHCPSGHSSLAPLVQPVCLEIIRNPDVSDGLRGPTIVLLANLSITVPRELRELQVADVLLDLIAANRTPEHGRTVAESVIILLHGSEVCRQVDTLMSMNVIADYCVPLLERTLAGKSFRGMYPLLLYSARLFQVLALCEKYAEALVADANVVPLLLRATSQEQIPLLRCDEGRRLAIEALRSLALFRLWPQCRQTTGREHTGNGPSVVGMGTAHTAICTHSKTFLEQDLPTLLEDKHVGVRSSAASLWVCVNKCTVRLLLSAGRQLEASGRLPCAVWHTQILTKLFPLDADAFVGQCV